MSMANSDSDKVLHSSICGHQFSPDARWPWTARKTYYERRVLRSGGKAVSCVDCGAGTDCRNLGYLNRRNPLHPRYIHSEDIDTLSIAPYLS